MDIFQLSPRLNLNQEIIRELESHIQVPDTGTADAENTLYVSTQMHEDDKSLFTSKAGLYILSKTPVRHVETLKNINRENNIIPIITLVGDCSMLYGRHTPAMFQEFLEAEGYLSHEQGPSFRMLLQESLINAVEYGNLGLAGKKDEFISKEDWFDEYQELVQRTLADQEKQSTPIIIQCYLSEDQLITSVTDAGQGFDYEKKLQDVEDNPSMDHRPHGMGLGLLKEFAHSIKYENEGKSFVFGIKTSFLREKVLSGAEELTLHNIRANGRILVVDDQASNRQFAKFYLISAGYQCIEEAANGQEAIEKALSFKPDIILLDIIMPDIDGFAVCRKLKQDPKTAEIPVLFLSGLTDVKNRIKGYRLGAVDYVNKPIDRNELIARTDIHIQNAIMFNSLQSFSRRIEKDLNKARVSQENLLPKPREISAICERHNLAIDHIFNACDELAGDYWSLFDTSDNTVAIAMADFTGHGVAAALNTVFIHALFHELKPCMYDPMLLTEKMNDQLKKLLNIGDFATFVFGLLNTETGEFKYVACGAPPIAVVPYSNDGEPQLLDCSGVPLGLMVSEDITFELREYQLNAGDTLFLYSDALTETQHAETGMWMDEGLVQALKDSRPEDELIHSEHVMDLFNKTAQTPLNDDLTLVSITYGTDKINEASLDKKSLEQKDNEALAG